MGFRKVDLDSWILIATLLFFDYAAELKLRYASAARYTAALQEVNPLNNLEDASVMAKGRVLLQFIVYWGFVPYIYPIIL